MTTPFRPQGRRSRTSFYPVVLGMALDAHAFAPTVFPAAEVPDVRDNCRTEGLTNGLLASAAACGSLDASACVLSVGVE